MTTSHVQASATIYEFPKRGRFAVAAQCDENNLSPRVARVAYGSGWYHDEAIEDDAERTRRI
jgi:hypothetical protein